MSARKVLFLMLAGCVLTALLLLYNSFYKPVSTSGVGLPAVTDQVQ